MTWQYPQARTLTRVSVFPVPFQSAAISPSNYDFDREVLHSFSIIKYVIKAIFNSS